MRIGIAGAGPAGLYFATLMKRADPRHEVTVYERNAPDATYGWGVVFSEETLSELRDADYATYVGLDAELVRWTGIDIRYGGQTLRAYGHGFSAISRRALLAVLQGRAAEAGVNLRFQAEVNDLAVFDGCDLVVGADGVRSVVRNAQRAAFGTTEEPHRARYVWYGIDLAFEVFTFIFAPTEYGVFQVHAYPYSASASTFIVECGPDTWVRAGLDQMDEQRSLAFCEDLFADHLGGHRLRSNRSLWTVFSTLRNRSWHYGRTVLVGDAAHTAHFSIGSGTKLALEDAIALAKAFVAHGEDLPAAFADYELERQGPVERFQQAALDSSRYFEHIPRYLGFPPEQFAFNLLTRSGRVTHASLLLRDPAATARMDAAFHAGAKGADAGRLVVAPPAYAPLRLRQLEIPNRVAVAVSPADDAADGRPPAAYAARLRDAAETGAGLVVTDLVAVSPTARVTPGSPGCWTAGHAGWWQEAREAVREAAPACRLAVRLGHAGPRGSTRPRHRGLDRPLPRGGWPTVAASAVPYLPGGPAPAPLSGTQLAEVVADFTAAARLLADAGVDLLVVDCSDGYLLAAFLSPLTNRRDDGLGGDLEARTRWPLEVVTAVRDVWPAQRPLAVRLLADDQIAGGLPPDEGVAAARVLADAGVDLVDVAAGYTTGTEATAADYRRLFGVGLADRVRNEAGIATLARGGITTVDEISTAVGAGRADLCLLDRWQEAVRR